MSEPLRPQERPSEDLSWVGEASRSAVPYCEASKKPENLPKYQVLGYCCACFGRVTEIMRTTIPAPVKAQPRMPRLVNVTTSAPATKSAMDRARLVRAILVIIMNSTLRSKYKLIEANTFTTDATRIHRPAEG